MTTTTPAASATALMSAAPGSGHGADHGRLLIRCQDRPGIVSAISTFLTDAGANIVTLAQHSTAEAGGAFFQRTEFHLPGLPAARDELERAFAADVASRFDIEFTLTEAAKPKRVAIMVSKTDHCVLDLLWRNRRGELDMSVVMVAPDRACRRLAEQGVSCWLAAGNDGMLADAISRSAQDR